MPVIRFLRRPEVEAALACPAPRSTPPWTEGRFHVRGASASAPWRGGKAISSAGWRNAPKPTRRAALRDPAGEHPRKIRS